MRGRLNPEPLDDMLGQCFQVYFSHLQLQSARLNARGVQQIVDQMSEPVRLLLDDL